MPPIKKSKLASSPAPCQPFRSSTRYPPFRRHLELHEAIQTQDEDNIRRLVKGGEKPCCSGRVYTCFQLATERRIPWPLFKLLLDVEPRGAKVVNKQGETTLMCYYREPGAIPLLLSLGANLQAVCAGKNVLWLALENPEAVLEVSTLVEAGIKLYSIDSNHGNSLHFLFGLVDKLQPHEVMQRAKILIAAGVNPFEETKIKIRPSWCRPRIERLRNGSDEAVHVVKELLLRMRNINQPPSVQYQAKVFQWLAILEYLFELPQAREANVRLDAINEELRMACRPIICDLPYMQNRSVRESMEAFLRDLLFDTGISRGYSDVTWEDLQRCDRELCIFSRLLQQYESNNINQVEVDATEKRVRAAVKWLARYDQSYLTCGVNPLLMVLMSKRTCPRYFKEERFGLTLISKTDGEVSGSWDTFQVMMGVYADFLIESGVHVHHASPQLYDVNKDVLEQSCSSRETLQFFQRVHKQLGVPDAICVAIKRGNLMCLRKLIPYCPAPPLALLLTGLLIEPHNDIKFRWLFAVLIEFGPIPHGTQIYQAVMSINSLSGAMRTILEKMHRRPLSLQDLCRAQVRQSLGRLAAQPGQPTLPELLRDRVPPGLRGYVMMIPREPLNVVSVPRRLKKERSPRQRVVARKSTGGKRPPRKVAPRRVVTKTDGSGSSGSSYEDSDTGELGF